MSFLKRAALGTAGLAGAFTGGIYYYSEGELTPQRLLISSVRSLRVGVAGARLLVLYKSSSQSMSEKHQKGAEIMKETFEINGGLYLKLGQLIATVIFAS